MVEFQRPVFGGDVDELVGLLLEEVPFLSKLERGELLRELDAAMNFSRKAPSQALSAEVVDEDILSRSARRAKLADLWMTGFFDPF